MANCFSLTGLSDEIATLGAELALAFALLPRSAILEPVDRVVSIEPDTPLPLQLLAEQAVLQREILLVQEAVRRGPDLAAVRLPVAWLSVDHAERRLVVVSKIISAF